MTKTKLVKAMALALSGSALVLVSSTASAIGVNTITPSFDRSAPVTVTGSSAVKNWADMAIDLGWMHTTKWFSLHVTSAGDTQIKLTDTSAAYTSTTTSSNATTGRTTVTTSNVNGASSNVAFSIWSFGTMQLTNTVVDPVTGAVSYPSTMTAAANPTTATSPLAPHYNPLAPQNNNVMGYNQVAAPAADNNSNFLAGGGVNGFVGYANSGDRFTNGNGSYVGSGSARSSVGSDASGHKFASLLVDLAAGDYLIALGGNCVNLTGCGNEITSKRVVVTDTATGALFSDTTTLNPANSWGLMNYQLEVTAVPVPGAVWLFGSAMAGLIGFGRRKTAIAA